MANSSFIGRTKNKIIKEFIKNKTLVKAIDSDTISEKEPEKLLNTHIFNYHQNPYTLQTVITFLTVQVHIPPSYDPNRTFVKPSVEIWIISHSRHMVVDNVPKITQNRNDYIAEIIDNMLNGRTGFGLGELKLVSNTEGAFQNDYLYRKLIFTVDEINNSFCIDE